MDYEKLYNEALKRAKKIHNQTEFNYKKDMMEEIFPELKESEGEILRKELIKFLKNASGGFLDTTIRCKTFGKWAAWLEKQGEKTLTVDIKSMVKSYKQRVLEQSNNMESPLVNMCVESFKHGVESTLDELNLKNLEKQGEKNPNWSEEDERIITALMEGFRYHQLFNPTFGEVPNAEIISWIKSLKERLS